MKDLKDIINTGLCIGCGICAFSDKMSKTIYSKKKGQYLPYISDETLNDENCLRICPGKGYNIIQDSMNLYNKAKYDLELGHVLSQYAAFSNDNQILENASSGGLMSHLAIFLLDNKIVDRVLTTQFSYGDELRTKCVLAKSREEILLSQGSKYCPVDVSCAIKEIKQNDFKVAIIGTPCQIAGIRNIQKIDPIFSRKIIITIANFCGGVKKHQNIQLIAKRKGIDPKNIEFFRFRGKGQPGSMLIKDTNGTIVEMPYPKYVGINGISKHLRCHLCVDATGELADISCGDAWLPRFLTDKNPWSIIILRNSFSELVVNKMIESDLITITPISPEEIKKSQHENLSSKKIRQKSRFVLYKILGFTLPLFDGGFYDNKLDLWTEIKVFHKHRIKEILEKLHLFNFVYNLIKK